MKLILVDRSQLALILADFNLAVGLSIHETAKLNSSPNFLINMGITTIMATVIPRKTHKILTPPPDFQA